MPQTHEQVAPSGTNYDNTPRNKRLWRDVTATDLGDPVPALAARRLQDGVRAIQRRRLPAHLRGAPSAGGARRGHAEAALRGHAGAEAEDAAAVRRRRRERGPHVMPQALAEKRAAPRTALRVSCEASVTAKRLEASEATRWSQLSDGCTDAVSLRPCSVACVGNARL
eukprot:2121359-Rhodomonas_salina.4